jgi:6-pyruvoyltetrahydropterin/6-carboxytetrahydropterin synthase
MVWREDDPTTRSPSRYSLFCKYDSRGAISMTERYRVTMRKAVHVFSAGHFITLNDELCEPIHGHNWTVACEVLGSPDTHGMVVDFIRLRDTLATIVARLDHALLLPTENRLLTVSQQTVGGQPEVEVRYGSRRWVFPADECRLLPLANTTAEWLGRWIGRELLAAFAQAGQPLVAGLRVEVDECLGQAAIWEQLPDSATGAE